MNRKHNGAVNGAQWRKRGLAIPHGAAYVNEMAARIKKLLHDEETRRRIQASQLINRLQDHVNGRVDLSSTQVRAAEILLRKIIPDLSNVELRGPLEDGSHLLRWATPDEKHD